MNKKQLLILISFIIISMFIFSCKKYNESLLLHFKKAEYNRNANDSILNNSVTNKDAEIRLAATQAIARIQSPESKDILIKLLKDENSNVRNWAAFGLGQLRDSTIASFLVEQLKNENDNRVTSSILIALGKTGVNDKGLIFIPYLKNNNIKIASAAATSVAYKAMQSPVSFNLIKEIENCYLKRKNDKVKEASAFTLFRIADTKNIKIYEQMLADNNINIRYYAIRGLLAALGKMKDEGKNVSSWGDYLLKEKNTDLNKIYSTILNDPDWQIQFYAFSLLEFLPNANIDEKFLNILERYHPYVLQALLNNLQYLGKEKEQLIISKLLQNGNEQICLMAQVEQARVNPEKGLQFIKNIVQNPTQPNLYYAVRAMNYLPDPVLIAEKGKFVQLNNKFWLNNLYNALAGKNLLVDADILTGLSNGDMAVVTIIADFLTKNPDQKYIKPLINAFYKFDCSVDAEPMIVLLKALDVIKSDKESEELVDFFDKAATNPDFQILFKSQKKWNYVNTKFTSGNESSLKFNFNIEDDIPEIVILKTAKGDIQIQLLPEVAPVTVNSFLSLAKSGYFDGLYFHRIVPGFVIQGGDPRGDGWGGPGYSIPCEYSMLEYEAGMVGMAHAGMDTGGSQFFITQMPQPHLNGRYTIWGKVREGMNVVNSLMPYDKIINVEFLTK